MVYICEDSVCWLAYVPVKNNLLLEHRHKIFNMQKKTEINKYHFSSLNLIRAGYSKYG